MDIKGILKIIAAAGLIVMIAMPLFYYGSLPDEIPRHYNFIGHPDGFGPKPMIWVLPVIGLAVFLLLNFLPRLILKQKPKKHQNPEDLHHQQQAVVLLLALVNTLIMMAFAYITVMSIRVAMGQADGLGVWFTPTFMVLFILMPLIYSIILFGRKTT